MAPVRRYLRITKYSVLECRIYLESASLTESWLLRKGDPALPRIIAAIRPLVLPKLREENERAKTKSRAKGKQAIKDVIVEDDFEVSIFLKDQSSRHTLLTKQKSFSDKPKLKSNSNKLTSWLSGGSTDRPIDVDEEQRAIMVEDGGDVDLSAIPEVPRELNDRTGLDSDDALLIPSDDDDEDEENEITSGRRGHKDSSLPNDDDGDGRIDDKKKLGLKTVYDGFAIYGRILCLIVKRRGVANTAKGPAPGQAMMENWVSTQVAQEMGLDQEEN